MKLKQQFEKHLGSNWILAGLHRGCTVQSRSSLHSRYIVSGSSVNAQSFLWWLKTFGGVVVAGEKTMHTLFLKKNAEWWFHLLLFFPVHTWMRSNIFLRQAVSPKVLPFLADVYLTSPDKQVDVLFGTVVIPYKTFLPLLQRNKVLFTSS